MFGLFRGKPVVDVRGARRYTDQAHAIAPRAVEFSWDGVPMHYIPGEPMATHIINVMHLVLPEGERAMSAALAEALPLIEDERLHEEVVGFIGQEATHASSHEGARDHLAKLGLDVEPTARKMEWMVDKVLGDWGLTGRAKHAWLCERLGLFAAMEHYTAVVGDWLLNADQLAERGMHPTMLDLVRWHGAEEVEHRNVAFDAFMYVDGGYGRRVRTALVASFTLAVLFLTTAGSLFRKDPSPDKGRFWPVQLLSATRRRMIPSATIFLTEIPKYLHPKFHPSQLGSMDKALRYLARSPAANGGAR
ncbi:metal-dependent hydrolase [Amycolatopsis magusensis]|uniref:Metal-dependent hydrolase n=1 Tax=Amycolatopsis magusensis TaxID=882444 RepID=A0ABS4PYU4_9PSEU|nr:metal-dependent hydrolase [Amycolatopsis magusensis]MBP2184593.1 putative metal-dependent hydrolase [Amycolatopsis magusensis]MDI5981160.1 metal-dependent hydrolase [Amycolatopsis magusensis]